jgi:hypothetical protein
MLCKALVLSRTRKLASRLPPRSQAAAVKATRKTARESDISENDQLQIDIATGEDSIWNPFGLYDGLTADMEEMKFEEELMTMDWEKWLKRTNNSTTTKENGTDEWATSPAWDPSLFSME